ncbi:MAG: CD3324 family protein [Clostridium sp.]|nr:CD3324 family protein [Clostridium sp.]
MKYRKASEIFPDELLKEIQKYSSGELVYIPKAEERNGWGSHTGARTFYARRNGEIRRKFHCEKKGVEELAREYHLSEETIRGIIYRKE